MTQTAVKICGITNCDDARAAADAGAHALGFVFCAASPRFVAPAAAGKIIHTLPPFLMTVGLFVNPGADEVERALADAPLNLLQFHGEETPEFCAQFGVPYIKAVRVQPGVDLLQYAQRYRAARGLLLDAFVEGTHGGTGRVFDWALIPRELPLAIILSGGLNPSNVALAIERVRPYAVDVSSGVESSPGVKDVVKIAAFMKEVCSAAV